MTFDVKIRISDTAFGISTDELGDAISDLLVKQFGYNPLEFSIEIRYVMNDGR